MDAAEEDQDVRLQRASADLLVDFEKSLDAFIWKTTTNGQKRIRKQVRDRETTRLVALVSYAMGFIPVIVLTRYSLSHFKNFHNCLILIWDVCSLS